jgi:phenylacetate-CoA ligase
MVSFSRAVETASREQIQAIKLRKMQRQVERLFATNEFYRTHLKGGGFHPDQLRGLDDVRRIPPVTKSMIIEDQDAHPPFGLRLGVPEGEVALIQTTSGTSGQGREVYGLTEADVELMVDSSLTQWMWSGLRSTDVGSSQVALTNSAAGVCMRPAVMLGGRYLYHVGHLSYGERLEWFERFGLNAMYGMPSYLATLLGVCEERGIDPRQAFPDFRFYILAGEAYPIAWAERMQSAWGIELHETYGSTL